MPPTPVLGRFRHVILLPDGAGRRLAFDGRCVELGNGWADLSPRLADARPDQWLPPAVVGATTEGVALTGERLADIDWREGHLLRDGDVVRAYAYTDGNPQLAYWLRMDHRWLRVMRIELREPRPVEALVERYATAT